MIIYPKFVDNVTNWTSEIIDGKNRQMKGANFTPGCNPAAVTSDFSTDTLPSKREKKIIFKEKRTPSDDQIGITQPNSIAFHLNIDDEEFRSKTNPCFDCNMCFSTGAHLQTHYDRFHGGHRPHQCKECGLKFKRKAKLRKHVEFVHQGQTKQKPHHCDLCQKTFPSKYNLKVHRLSHTGERPFSCTQCDKGFKEEHLLRQHVRVHSNETPYACDECGKQFRFRNAYRQHTAAHRRQATHVCDDCGKAFQTASNLTRHTTVPNTKLAYFCDLCSKFFNRQCALRAHRWTHVGDMSVDVTATDRRFTVAHSRTRPDFGNTDDTPRRHSTPTAGSYNLQRLEMPADSLASEDESQDEAPSYSDAQTTSTATDEDIKPPPGLFNVNQSDLGLPTPRRLRSTRQSTSSENQASEDENQTPRGIVSPLPTDVSKEGQPSTSIEYQTSEDEKQLRSDRILSSTPIATASDKASTRSLLCLSLTPPESQASVDENQLTSDENISSTPVATTSNEAILPTRTLLCLSLTPFESQAADRIIPQISTSKEVAPEYGMPPASVLLTLECHHCPKVFVRKANLVSHLRQHGIGEKPYPCDVCGERFNQIAGLKRHKRAAHSSERLFCDECGRAFVARSMLTRHAYVHAGVRAHACVHCEARFTQRSNLTLHMRTHTGERPFACRRGADVDCQRRFAQRTNRRQHERKAHGAV